MSGLFYADDRLFAEHVGAFFDRQKSLRFTVAQRFQGDFGGRELGFADDQRKPSSALVRMAQLGLEARRRHPERDPDAGQTLAEPVDEREAEPALRITGRDELRVQGPLAGSDAFGLHELDDALEPEGPADGRGIAPTELRHEAVVAPARADGVLRAGFLRDPLEDGARVVV